MTNTPTPEAPHYDAPTEPISIPNVDDLTFGELFRIKGATGIDVIKSAQDQDLTAVTVAVLWHVISQRPEYAGITFSNVLEWPMTALAESTAPADDDADDIRETVQEMSAQQALEAGQPLDGDGIPFTDPHAPESV